MARHQRVVHQAADGDHGQAAVLELGQGVALALGGVLAEAQGVEAEVSWFVLGGGERREGYVRCGVLVSGVLVPVMWGREGWT